jgi:hypothetical protein
MLYIWSRDVGWLAEASALLQTAMKFALVSVIVSCFWEVTTIEHDLMPLSDRLPEPRRIH